MYTRFNTLISTVPHRRHINHLLSPAVSIHMYLQIDLLLKSLPAIRTQKRAEVRVCAHVCVQVGRPVECLLADHADVGLDGGVGESVAGQVARLPERPRTHLTLKRLLPGVDPLEIKNKIINNH